ncbi:MAG TPA: hypothetical protein VGJ21_11105 [Terracidiphilus sp.]|jgi:hypothetical protein
MRQMLHVKFALIAIALSVILPNCRAQASLAGDWRGSLDANGTPLRIIWHVTVGADGAISSTFDNVDESIMGIKVKTTEIKGSDVTASVDDTVQVNGQEVNVKGVFAGKLNADQTEVEGTWTQTEPEEPSMPLTLKHQSTQAAPPPAGAPTAPQGTGQASLVGDWKGVLMDQLHLVLHITAGKDGALAATLDSVDQNAPGILVNAVTLKDGKLSLTVSSVNGAYEGTVSNDGNSIDGTWSQGQDLPLKFTRVGGA